MNPCPLGFAACYHRDARIREIRGRKMGLATDMIYRLATDMIYRLTTDMRKRFETRPMVGLKKGLKTASSRDNRK
jgi:hypothetical protein